MLQTIYARAKESRTRGVVHDGMAEKIIDRLDYDFSLADNDRAMHDGVIARTIVLDRMTKSWLDKNPGAVIVNIACGLDTRCYRVKEFSHWYNLDLPETIRGAGEDDAGGRRNLLYCHVRYGRLGRMRQGDRHAGARHHRGAAQCISPSRT